ncbi:hypothetical protein [Gaopeijia maritima]|uniref:Uncharacterized protein n=1 Tax=Gaopeijia maritima TaxID=3119007 RepID=A0ABU9EFQ9_9BACT
MRFGLKGILAAVALFTTLASMPATGQTAPDREDVAALALASIVDFAVELAAESEVEIGKLWYDAESFSEKGYEPTETVAAALAGRRAPLATAAGRREDLLKCESIRRPATERGPRRVCAIPDNGLTVKLTSLVATAESDWIAEFLFTFVNPRNLPGIACPYQAVVRVNPSRLVGGAGRVELRSGC